MGSGFLEAQLQDYNHPELKWRTIETDHFYIHFHQGEPRTASLIAKIAEDIYEPITSLYDHVPDGKIHFIVRDHDDDSNGAAFYYDNKIEIWAPSMDFPLRGTHDWLRNVVTHEFSHMISLGAARKMPRQIPAIYMQWLDYEKEKRPDVLHGYPRTIVSVPLAGTVIPLWFAEGLAQFHRAGLDYDTWDTHRDMLLRTAVLGECLLSLDEMSIFGKNSLGNERVYNQGYGLTLYLAHKYGEKILSDLIKAMKTPWRISFSGGMKKVLKKSESAFYGEWSAWLRQGYGRAAERIRQYSVQGHILEERGIANFYPVFSPDGKQVAYLSNRGRDYLSQVSLRLIDLESGQNRLLKSGVTSSMSWSPDGKKLVYAKKKARMIQGSHYYDLFIYDIEKKKENRLTRSLRVRQPDWSGNGEKLVCVVEQDGTTNLAVMGTDGKGFRKITNFEHGEQVYIPRWIGKEDRIVFAISGEQRGRDIAVIDSDGTGFTYLIRTEHDERDPFPDIEAKNIYYSSDATGIFNIYRLDLTSGNTVQLTNVLGGAFMPSVSQENHLVYSHFQAKGYKIARIDSLKEISPEGSLYHSPYQSLREDMNTTEWKIAHYDDGKVPEFESRPYKPIYSKITFLPRIMVDFPQKVKVGTYFYGSDFLDKVFLLGGVAVNGLFDTDIFAIFEYRQFYPTLFLEAYQQMRHVTFNEVDAVFKLRYNLMEVDIGADWKLDDFNSLRTAFVYSRYSYAGSGEFPYQNVFGKFTSTYHRGSVLQLKWTHRAIRSSMLSSIAPAHGRMVALELDRAWQSYGDSAGVSEKHGTPVDIYSRHSYNQIIMDWREYLPGLFKDHSVALRFRGGLIDRMIPSFYHFFGGGLDGLKGYPYYSIEGRKHLHLGLAYRVPIFRKMGFRFLFMHFDKLFLSLYGDAGDAWNRGKVDFSRWKRTLGVQFRLGLVSFYSYPMSLFVDTAYGLDRFIHRDQEYGKEWRFYFGILFDFLD